MALAGALAGGYIGARLAEAVPADLLQRSMVGIGGLPSAVHFLH